MEKQPSGPYSGDMVSFRGQEVRGWGWPPSWGHEERRPGEAWAGAGVRCRELGFRQREAEQEGTEELLEQGSLWAAGTRMHTRRGTNAYVQAHRHAQARACI